MNEDRKTLEQRAQMTDLERLRHSASHVLATAILKIWPEAQFAAGPPVETGFYYDVDLPHRISPEDFEKIEAEMKKEIKANHPFEKMEVSRDEALDLGKKGRLAALSDRQEPSKFKIDIIENIPANEKISLYRNGDFLDLCAGPHVMRTGNIGAFRLTNVASAYYRVMKRTRSSSAFTAPPSRTRHNSTNTLRCWRKRRSATIVNSAKNWRFTSSTMMSDPVCRSGFRAAPP